MLNNVTKSLIYYHRLEIWQLTVTADTTYWLLIIIYTLPIRDMRVHQYSLHTQRDSGPKTAPFLSLQ